MSAVPQSLLSEERYGSFARAHFVRKDRVQAKNAKVEYAELIANQWHIAGDWSWGGKGATGTAGFEVTVDAISGNVTKRKYGNRFFFGIVQKAL